MTVPRSPRPTRDQAPHQARNICGSLLRESGFVFGALHAGQTLPAVREAALSGTLFRQRSYQARRRFWHAVHGRYLTSSPEWIIAELVDVVGSAPASPDALGLLYIHFVIRDRLTLDIVKGPLWSAWSSGRLAVDQSLLRMWMDGVAPEFYGRLTEGTQRKLATSILTGLRDFGVLQGLQKKAIVRPVVTPRVFAHLLRILADEGQRGSAIVDDPTWRILLLSRDEVVGHLAALAQQKVIRFERAGSTVVLELPWGTP